MRLVSASGRCSLIADPTGSGTLVAIGTGQAFISRDWGATFQAFGPTGVGFPSAAAFDSSHPAWIPAIALAPDESAYAGVSALPGASGASLLHGTTANSGPIPLNQISNAFSGEASALVGGGPYTLGIAGFQPPSPIWVSVPMRICRMN